VGLETYEAAGGAVLRDLFEEDGGGWLQDVALLDRLVTEKLAAEAQNVATEGWKWIEVAADFRYGHANHLRRLHGEPVELSAEERATFDALTAEYAKLEGDYEGADELPDDVDARLSEIETALAGFDNRPLRYDPADIARAGVFVSIDADGTLAVDRGYVRPQNEPSPGTGGAVLSSDGAEPSASPSQTVITVGGVEAEEDREDDSVRPLSES
jgi:ParB family chromosome partitioning protein